MALTLPIKKGDFFVFFSIAVLDRKRPAWAENLTADPSPARETVLLRRTFGRVLNANGGVQILCG